MTSPPRTFFINELLHSGHIQSVGAASIVYLAARLLNVSVTATLLFVPYLVFQAIYYFDRYYDLNHDATTNAKRTQHLRAYAPHIPKIIILLLALAFYLLVRTSTPAALSFFVIITLMGAWYPIKLKKITRTIPFFKNVYVSLVFAIIVFFPFLHHANLHANRDAIIISLFVFFESLIVQILLDIKDSASDRQQHLITSPILFGRHKTILIAASISIINAAALIGYALNHPQFTNLVMLATVSVIYNAIALNLVARRTTGHPALVAAKYLTWAAVFLLSAYA